MPATFAALEARVNNAVFSRLANVDATVNGVAMSGIFDNGFALAQIASAGMAATQPTLVVPTSSLSADPVGQAVTVGAASYLVGAHEPDGTGVSTLLLERA